jgi:hypothetical protein
MKRIYSPAVDLVSASIPLKYPARLTAPVSDAEMAAAPSRWPEIEEDIGQLRTAGVGSRWQVHSEMILARRDDALGEFIRGRTGIELETWRNDATSEPRTSVGGLRPRVWQVQRAETVASPRGEELRLIVFKCLESAETPPFVLWWRSGDAPVSGFASKQVLSLAMIWADGSCLPNLYSWHTHRESGDAFDALVMPRIASHKQSDQQITVAQLREREITPCVVAMTNPAPGDVASAFEVAPAMIERWDWIAEHRTGLQGQRGYRVTPSTPPWWELDGRDPVLETRRLWRVGGGPLTVSDGVGWSIPVILARGTLVRYDERVEHVSHYVADRFMVLTGPHAGWHLNVKRHQWDHLEA